MLSNELREPIIFEIQLHEIPITCYKPRLREVETVSARMMALYLIPRRIEY
jgi:hypothetical protein